MNDLSPLQSGLPARIRSRSMGMKLIVVCGLALLMMIPALFVRELVRGQDQPRRRCNPRHQSTGGRSANFPGSDPRHSLQHCAEESR